MAAIITNIVSVWFCLSAFKIRDYWFTRRVSTFFTNEGYSKEDCEKHVNFNNKEIEKYSKLKMEDFLNKMLYSYLICNDINAKNSKEKAKKIILS